MDSNSSGGNLMNWINEKTKEIDFEEAKLRDSMPENTDRETLKEEFHVRYHWIVTRVCEPFILEDGSLSLWSNEELKLANSEGIDLATYKTANEMNAFRKLFLQKRE